MICISLITHRYKSLPAVAGGPLFMLLGATVGGAVANALSINEPLLVGCTSFGGK